MDLECDGLSEAPAPSDTLRVMLKSVAVGLGDAPRSMSRQGVDMLETRPAGVAVPWVTLTVNSSFGLDTLMLVRA